MARLITIISEVSDHMLMVLNIHDLSGSLHHLDHLQCDAPAADRDLLEQQDQQEGQAELNGL